MEAIHVVIKQNHISFRLPSSRHPYLEAVTKLTIQLLQGNQDRPHVLSDPDLLIVCRVLVYLQLDRVPFPVEDELHEELGMAAHPHPLVHEHSHVLNTGYVQQISRKKSTK
jgi:hypothetical protein